MYGIFICIYPTCRSMRQRVSHIKRSLASSIAVKQMGIYMNIRNKNAKEERILSLFFLDFGCLHGPEIFFWGGMQKTEGFSDSITILKYTTKSLGNQTICGPLLWHTSVTHCLLYWSFQSNKLMVRCLPSPFLTDDRVSRKKENFAFFFGKRAQWSKCHWI